METLRTVRGVIKTVTPIESSDYMDNVNTYVIGLVFWSGINLDDSKCFDSPPGKAVISRFHLTFA